MSERRRNTLKPIKVRSSELDSLISAPLSAIARANSMMAKEQVQFLLNFCFSYDGVSYRPVMITMTIDRSVVVPGEIGKAPKIETVEMTILVPLITLLPLSSLGIVESNIHFEFESHLQYDIQDDQIDNTDFTKQWSSNTNTKLLGAISSSANISNAKEGDVLESSSASIIIDIESGTFPLPLGVTILLEAFSKSINPIEEESDPCKDN